MEMIKLADINRTHERTLKSHVKYRFAIDMA
jgi:D-arabinose 1-dehydrogenase-like Zn-dependent alcohol dehydrogenase